MTKATKLAISTKAMRPGIQPQSAEHAAGKAFQWGVTCRRVPARQAIPASSTNSSNSGTNG